MDVPARLAHLRTDHRGIPVPMVNQWGKEDSARFTIEHDPVVGGPAVFLHDEGETVPDFTRQNIQRQRLCVGAGLCQVCGRKVPWSRRYLVISSISAETVKLPASQVAGGRMREAFGNVDVTVITEPWLDEWCAWFAVERCPALIRRKQTNDLTVVKVTSKRDCRLVVSRGWVDGPLEAISRQIMPFMWGKVYLPKLLITQRR